MTQFTISRRGVMFGLAAIGFCACALTVLTMPIEI